MGGSIFFFVESKTFEFSIEEGGTYYMLRIFERNRDSLRSVFMGKESANRLLAIVEDLMSNVIAGNFARTFRDGDKVFILHLGSNAHGSFFMISELVHGRRKGFIVVPEGKLGSGWRGFGLHLRKAIAPKTLVIKKPQSVLKQTVEKSNSVLLAMAETDRREGGREGGGSKKGKPLMPNIQNSNKSNLHNHSQDTRELNTRKEVATSEAKFTFEIQDIVGRADFPLSLDVSMRLECGPDAPFKPKPNPILIWRPKPKQSHSHSLPSDETQNTGNSLPLVSVISERDSSSSNAVVVKPIHPQTDPCSSTTLAQSLKLSNDANIEIHGIDEADTESFGSVEADESATTSDGEDNLQQDIRLLLQEHSGNVIKKWGNSEQWVLELRDGRRVAVPLQISLPPSEVTEVMEEKNQLTLVPLKSSDSLDVSAAPFEGDEVLVEDWVSDTYSEAAELPNNGGLLPLAVEPLAFSLPLVKEG
ncbi:hypothetical protein SO802_027031 [Lithocarpus litseifolius]|uniref:Uncharacterized protein n=1 Tax=Lithocarpus litseifolius TaxID=425828 RepID=A0AAW2C1J5_9ROSI